MKPSNSLLNYGYHYSKINSSIITTPPWHGFSTPLINKFISDGPVSTASTINMYQYNNRTTRSISNVTIQSVTEPSIAKQMPFKRLNTRVTVMLITLNITFCIFSMPMVILQIIYYSFYQFLENTSYYLYTTSSIESNLVRLGTSYNNGLVTRFAQDTSAINYKNLFIQNNNINVRFLQLKIILMGSKVILY